MILYRLLEDYHWLNLLAGSCITEDRFKQVYYIDKPCFEPIQEYEVKDLLKYDDESYCAIHNIECALFYNQKELELFLSKI